MKHWFHPLRKEKESYLQCHSLPKKKWCFILYMGYQGKSDQVTRATWPQNWNDHELDNLPRVFIYSPPSDHGYVENETYTTCKVEMSLQHSSMEKGWPDNHHGETLDEPDILKDVDTKGLGRNNEWSLEAIHAVEAITCNQSDSMKHASISKHRDYPFYFFRFLF